MRNPEENVNGQRLEEMGERPMRRARNEAKRRITHQISSSSKPIKRGNIVHNVQVAWIDGKGCDGLVLKKRRVPANAFLGWFDGENVSKQRAMNGDLDTIELRHGIYMECQRWKWYTHGVAGLANKPSANEKPNAELVEDGYGTVQLRSTNVIRKIAEICANYGDLYGNYAQSDKKAGNIERKRRSRRRGRKRKCVWQN